MADFSTSLLREKFAIHDPETGPDSTGEPVLALSNRMVVSLTSKNGEIREKMVVRAQNMHTCVRMAARIVHAFDQGGPVIHRAAPFDWDAAWKAITGDYEIRYNPNCWVAVYGNGTLAFEAGQHQPLLDVIEKCDAGNEDIYDASIHLAENEFKKAGKVVNIEYDGNVAMVVSTEGEEARLGIILRGPNRTTTFNFTVQADRDRALNLSQILTTAAAYLEGIQLAFLVGMNNEKLRLDMIREHSDEERQTKEGRRRLSRLSAEIANLEGAYDVHYRPERPDFQHIVMDAEGLARKIFAPPESFVE